MEHRQTGRRHAALRSLHVRVSPRRWAFVALVLVAAAFLLGGWLESRVAARARAQDARLAALVEQYAPEHAGEAVAALSQEDPALAARGEALLEQYGYAPAETTLALRAILTAFMLGAMLLRGGMLGLAMRRAYRRARRAREAYRSARQAAQAAPPPEEIPVREAIADLAAQLRVQETDVRALCGVLLEQKLAQEGYERFAQGLRRQLDRLRAVAEDLAVLAQEQGADVASQVASQQEGYAQSCAQVCAKPGENAGQTAKPAPVEKLAAQAAAVDSGKEG